MRQSKQLIPLRSCVGNKTVLYNLIYGCHGNFGPGDQNSRKIGPPGPKYSEKFGPDSEKRVRASLRASQAYFAVRFIA